MPHRSCQPLHGTLGSVSTGVERLAAVLAETGKAHAGEADT